MISGFHSRSSFVGGCVAWLVLVTGTCACRAKIESKPLAPVSVDAATGAQVAARRAAVRALARAADSEEALLRALEDEDRDVVAWASFGLGESCAGREEVHVRAIAARLLSLAGAAPPGDSGAFAPRVVSIALQALGRCGGVLAEAALVPWLARDVDASQAAAYALGEIAARRGLLDEASERALLDALEGPPPLGAAFYPFALADRPANGARNPLTARLVVDAQAALARPGAARIFALQALGRADASAAVPELARVWSASESTLAERIEAARALGRAKDGAKALAQAMRAALPSPLAALDEGGAAAAWSAALAALGPEPPAEAVPILWALATHLPRSDGPPSGRRRASTLRCAAALALGRRAWDADLLRTCDVADGEAGERARLEALDRGPLVGARRAAWGALARSPHLRVAEAAIALVESHRELGEAAERGLASALSDSRPGVVSAAAVALRARPDRVGPGLADDAEAGTPSDRHEASSVLEALRAALARPWPAFAAETRAALIDAALALRLVEEGRAAALCACTDPNPALRARAAAALAALGDVSARCAAPVSASSIAAPVGDRPTTVRLALDTDVGPLGIVLDPASAPLEATRVVALARSGFFDGASVERVEPGLLVVLGAPTAGRAEDSGVPVEESSPTAFGPLDVGLAAPAPDSGASPLFVTLSRDPRLDGRAAWLGRAEGPWASLAEGDLVRSVHVEATR